MTDIESFSTFWISPEDRFKATTYDRVQWLTSQGYWVWEISRMLGITECQVVAYQGRA